MPPDDDTDLRSIKAFHSETLPPRAPKDQYTLPLFTLKANSLPNPSNGTKLVNGNEKVIATAREIVRRLGPCKKNKEDMIDFLSNSITDFLTLEKKTKQEIEAAEKKMNQWNLSNVGKDASTEYLQEVDSILKLAENSVLLLDGDYGERVDSIIEMAMLRLGSELRNLLIKNSIRFDHDKLCGSYRRNSVSSEAEACGSSVEDESFVEDLDLWTEMARPDAVAVLKEIADRMIRAGYEKECCQVYSSVRRDVLNESLLVLGFEKMSKGELQKVEWRVLDERMKRWVYAIKIVVRVVLFGEKQLCARIFGGWEKMMEVCFMETAKGCVRQMLEFGEAIMSGKQASEKLFRILDMYEALDDLLLDLKSQFGSGSFICREAQRILAGLGDAAKGTFSEFQNAVQREQSPKPTQRGEIHPLMRYVMNYLMLLVEYSDSMNSLIESSKVDSNFNDSGSSPLGSMSPLARSVLSLLSCLESNLDEKSKLYDDGGLRYVFLMNNIFYTVQKVKSSELGKLLGDQFVRKRRCQIRQYATAYLRVSWTKILLSLKDEGLGRNRSSSSASKTILKERFKSFNAAFEEIYKKQTAWRVPDPQLKEELLISISENIIPAYRSFMGRFRGHLDGVKHVEKYIKYMPEDIENHLSDLFLGSPKVLQSSRRKLKK